MKPIRILFVCHGNICRSPMAEFIMKNKISAKGLDDTVAVGSCATSTEELGNPIYPPARAALSAHGIDYDDRRARQMTPSDYRNNDMIFAMDRTNIRNIGRIIGNDPAGKVRLLNSCAGKETDISDPWYSGDFEETFIDIDEACSALMRTICRMND